MAITRLADGQFMEANGAFFSLLGYDRDEVIGKTTAELGTWRDAGDREALMAQLRASEGRPVIVQLPIRTRTGDSIVDELSLSLITWRGERCLLAVTRGTTEREEVLRMRERREAQLRLLAQLPAVFWTTDTHLVITSSGGSGLGALGLARDDIVGRSLTEYLGTDDPTFIPIQAHHRALAGASSSYDLEWQGLVYHTHVAPLRRRSGRARSATGGSSPSPSTAS
jgi:PAS domain S-box-containing protein